MQSAETRTEREDGVEKRKTDTLREDKNTQQIYVKKIYIGVHV